MSKQRLPPNPVFPLPILVDTREQLPFSFTEIPADESEGGGFWQIETLPATLVSGDYSIFGYADKIAIERKSLADLFSTVGQGRGRFERELERLNGESYLVAEIVVEAELSEVIMFPPEYSQLDPKIISRSVTSWRQRFRRVHWNFLLNRAWAEVQTFRILHKFWKEQCKRGHEAVKEQAK